MDPTYMNKWVIKHHSDPAGDIKPFLEWWTVTNDERAFDCNNEEDANWLCLALNTLNHTVNGDRPFANV